MEIQRVGGSGPEWQNKPDVLSILGCQSAKKIWFRIRFFRLQQKVILTIGFA